jgi:hypothetical protein
MMSPLPVIACLDLDRTRMVRITVVSGLVTSKAPESD